MIVENAKSVPPRSISIDAILNQPLKLIHRFYCGMDKIAKLMWIVNNEIFL